MLPAFKEKFPQYEVATEIRKGKHPYLKGEYSKLLFLPFFFCVCVWWKVWNLEGLPRPYAYPYELTKLSLSGSPFGSKGRRSRRWDKEFACE